MSESTYILVNGVVKNIVFNEEKAVEQPTDWTFFYKNFNNGLQIMPIDDPCKHENVYHRQVQKRSGDEIESVILVCRDCGMIKTK